jgi:phenylacetyl-CoA:acceptor oxidoreductase subunit 2
MAGGAGGGVVVFAALAGGSRWTFLLGAALVALGIASVALEIGRPLRTFHVCRNPRTSWMSRDAIAALLLFGCVAAARLGVALAGGAAGLAALAFVYCQGRMRQAAKGIPAWRERRIVPLFVATRLAKGGRLFLLDWALSATAQRPGLASGLFALSLLARWLAGRGWRQRLRAGPQALRQIDRAGQVVTLAMLLPLTAGLAVELAPLTPTLARPCPTLLHSPPSLSRGWLDDEHAEAVRAAGGRLAMSSDAALAARLREAWRQAAGLPVFNGGGSSEALTRVFGATHDDGALQPSPGVQVQPRDGPATVCRCQEKRIAALRPHERPSGLQPPAGPPRTAGGKLLWRQLAAHLQACA